jgi:short subunit dehydrogenase-like uncharacterized protein
VLKEIADSCSKQAPPLLTADLVCETPEQEDILRQTFRDTKVFLTCAGPFEKYGTMLVKLCTQEGVCYADITGETDLGDIYEPDFDCKVGPWIMSPVMVKCVRRSK